MSIEDITFIKSRTCVLKVNIHCHGCKKKVNKLLHQIEGVYQTDIDAEQGKVIVLGNVDPAILLKKLNEAGRHAELWDWTDENDDDLSHQLQKLQLEDEKGRPKDNGKLRRGCGGGGGGGGKGHKGRQPAPQKQMKGLKDMKLPQLKGLKLPFRKNQKSVKCDLPPESDVDEESGDDEDIDDVESGGPQPMGNPNMMAQGFQGMNLGRMGSMQHGPMSHMGNIPAGAVPPGYLQGGIMAAAMIVAAADNPYQQQYMAAMIQQQSVMMMNGQGGGAAASLPAAYGPGTPAYAPMAPPLGGPYTNFFSDENPNGCSIV